MMLLFKIDFCESLIHWLKVEAASFEDQVWTDAFISHGNETAIKKK